jgi:hypothetical protein
MNLKKFWHRKEVDALLEKGCQRHAQKFQQLIEYLHLTPEVSVSVIKHISEAYKDGAKEWCDNLGEWLEQTEKHYKTIAPEPSVSPELRLKALEMAKGDVEKAKELVAFLAGEEK